MEEANSGKRARFLAGRFLQEYSRKKRCCGTEQPLDAPDLHGLPVQHGLRGEDEPDRNRPEYTSHADDEGDQRAGRKANSIPDIVEFQMAGELQGAISSLTSLAWIIGPTLFTFTFAYFIEPARGWNAPGAPWYLGGFLLFVAMFMATRMPKLESQSIPPTAAPSNYDL